MKRPMATIGFSMLVTFLLITNITHKMTIVLLIGAIVIFCFFILFKRLRKYLSVIFTLFGAIIFTVSFISAEKYYFNEMIEMKNEQMLTGIVCEKPTDSDYAFSYVIKPEGKNYKVRVVSNSDRFLYEGDCVIITGKCTETEYTEDLFESSLSSRIYFTFFEGDECKIEKTGEVNWYYKNIGTVKRVFSEIVTQYLPGRNGAIAMAMTIGDKSELDRKVVNNFNYCGTSHLLVISGLHLTLWSLGIINFIYRFSRLRRKAPVVGIICLLIYASITGFSVSVLRAGAMVVAVLVAKLFNRDSDSINSIGLALTFILVLNPFAAFSVALWLTVLSTMGILVYSGKIQSWIREKTQYTFISKIPLYNLAVTTTAISFSTMVFTLPVFIFNFRMVSVVSILTNFLMVDLAMVMMLTTVIGTISHILFLKPIANICFIITGAIGEFLHFIAEKIGMAEWSTISLSHKYYEYFFAIMIIGFLVVFVAEKHKIHIAKHITVLLSVVFVLLTVHCISYDYNNASVEIIGTDRNPVVTINHKGETILVGTQKKKYIDDITDLLNTHNKKKPDGLLVTEIENATVSEIINIYNNFGRTKTYFYDDAPQIFADISESDVRGLSLYKNVEITIIDKDCVSIKANEKTIVIADGENAENIYENTKDCDIIILYGKNAFDYEANIAENIQIIELTENEKISINF